MTPATVIKASNSAQFLSLLPQLFQFQPERSVVFVPFSRGRTIGAMRFDLPEDAPEDTLEALMRAMTKIVGRINDIDEAAIVIYSARALGETAPHTEVADAATRHLAGLGLGIVDALCVASDGWVSYVDGERGSLEALTVLAPGAEHLPPVAGSQHMGTDLPPVSDCDSAGAEAAFWSIEAVMNLACRSEGSGPGRINPQALEAVGRLHDLPGTVAEMLEWDVDNLTDYQAGLLLWCLSRSDVRDVTLVTWTAGTQAGAKEREAHLRWEAGEDYPQHVSMQMWGEGARPDPDHLEKGLELARRACALAPGGHLAGPLAAAAWLSWALGRSTHADAYATRACALEPQHELAELVLSFVSTTHLPEWAFAAVNERVT